MDVNSLLKSVLGSAESGVEQFRNKTKDATFEQGLMGGAAAGGLLGLLLGSKKSRKIAGNIVTYGGLAALGGLAYKAWKDQQKDSAGATQIEGEPSESTDIADYPAPDGRLLPEGSIFDLADNQNQTQGDSRLILIRAMISAAKVDGHIDADERSVIEAKIEEFQIGSMEKRFLVDQLNAPSDPILIAQLANGEEQGLEIYAASLLAIDIDTPEERRYLERLADALHLSEKTRQMLETELS